MTEPVPPTHLEFNSWDELLAALSRIPDPWIFRGQRNYDWNLLTKLGRDLRALDESHGKDWRSLENSSIGYFMDRANGLMDRTPDEHDLLGWLSFMQHYGAPTRLLDWSFSPYVALYFAYEQPTESDSAIYAINSYLSRRTNVGSLFPMPWDHLGVTRSSSDDTEGNTVSTYPSRERYRRDYENEILQWAIETESKCPLPTIPFYQDDRMIAQQTVFTLMGNIDVELDIWFDKSKWEFPQTKPGGMITGTDNMMWPLEEPSQLLRKIRLRKEWRERALDTLRQMGISASTLFPGLDGIGRATSGHLLSGRLNNRDLLTGWIVS